MSQHNSLRVDSVGTKHRNVLTRLERFKKMQVEEKWSDASRIYGLPKLKSIKMKVKKTKEAPAAEEGAAKAGAAPAAKVAAPAGKVAAPAAPKAAGKPPAGAKK